MKKSSILLMFLILALLAGCLGERTQDGKLESYPAPAPMTKGIADESRASTASQPSYAVDRKVIKTAQLSIEVKEFQAAMEEVARIAAQSGGFVSDSRSYVTTSKQHRGSVTMRVPEKEFQGVIEKLRKLGEVKSESSTGQDVTEEYIDLEARLNNYKKQEQRLLEILDKAKTVEEVLKVEEQLARVRGEIERITGRIIYLKNRIELASITVELFEPEPIAQSLGIRNSISEAVSGFIATINGLIVLTGTLLPVIILAALLWYAVSSWRRRKAKAAAE